MKELNKCRLIIEIQWISNFSTKISLLTRNQQFPVSEEVKRTFESLKNELEKAAVYTIDPNRSLTVETDASDIAIAATLNQDGQPVAFFSRSSTKSERKHSSVEKEAYAIVESLRKWKHFLVGKAFTLVKDQRSVSFMYNRSNKGKIKNEKIQRWKLELSCFHYDVIYRPGKQNTVADTFTRKYLSAITRNDLKLLHTSLCHPGVTRLLHYVRTKNLPFSCDDVRTVIEQCQACAEQIEKLNGTLWKAITLALHSMELDVAKWELVLNDAQQSIRSLLCTATNRTPHERLLGFNRRSGSGTSLPTWLTSPGPVLLKKNVRSSKYDPITEEVDLVTCNPQYAVIRTPNGREETVSLRMVAPREDQKVIENENQSRTELDIGCPVQSSPPRNQPTDSIMPEETTSTTEDIARPSETQADETTHTYNLRVMRTRPNYKV
uniref:Reverse transcriptase RNase H-like domain-containing protein n=1 Tax=Biomphalaria glabrata TaxID=6526 RepID=A0A2C9L106_BIOGL